MINRSKVLPVVILILLISMAVIASNIGKNQDSTGEAPSAGQTGGSVPVAQEQIDELKQKESFGEEGVVSPDTTSSSPAGAERPLSWGLRRYDSANERLDVGAQITSRDLGGVSCLFRLSDGSGLTLELKKEVLSSTPTQQGCEQANFDVSKLRQGDAWIIEVRVLDAGGNALASLVENYKVQQ